jgi:polyphosphate kinase
MLLGKTPPVEDPSKLSPSSPSLSAASTNSSASSVHPIEARATSSAPRPNSPSNAASLAAGAADDASRAAKSKELSELRHPSLFLNRELTWLNFNHRVLNEAQDRRTPLLERVKFLAIVGSNLDEFHMKRIGGLKQLIGADVGAHTIDGRTPRQQIEECRATISRMLAIADEVRVRLLRALAQRGIRIVAYRALRQTDQNWMRQFYIDNIFPLVTPQAIDPAHPFPFVSNLSLNLLVSVRDEPEGNSVLSRIKLPVGQGIPRLVPLRDSHTFVMLEDVVAHNLDLLFPNAVVESCDLFRVTRNAVTEKDEEQADDLLELIESELRERKFAPVVRLQVDAGMDAVRRERLARELELRDHDDVFETTGMLGLRDLMELASLSIPDLHERPQRPLDHPQLAEAVSIFQAIRQAGSLLVHHPYQSFASSVGRFLRDAAHDTSVRAIKMTLYRTSEETNVVEHLIDAARNGKQVAVVVELKARFDEAANIRWASRLEEAGIHVTYGLVGLKTHAKVVLVVRQESSGLSRYVHIGTGNYHAGTAKLYTDLGLFTCDDRIARDATELFNFLTTGVGESRRFQKLLLGPRSLKRGLIERIEREATHAREQKPALIQMKMNALEDPDIVRALYRASQAGVQIDLIVRDTCRLRPGVPGLSENIRVLSIVGRFLEHARAFYFCNAGDEEYFIGSADLMTRNLESRVEVLAPIEPKELRAELRQIFDVQLADRRSAWDMQADGSYVQRSPKGRDSRKNCQDTLLLLMHERHEQALEKSAKAKKRSRTRRTGVTRKRIMPTRASLSAPDALKKLN